MEPVSLLVGGTLAFGYSILDYHSGLSTYLGAATTDNYDAFKKRGRARRRCGWWALGGCGELGPGAPAPQRWLRTEL